MRGVNFAAIGFALLGTALITTLAFIGVGCSNPSASNWNAPPFLVVEHEGVRVWAVTRYIPQEGVRTVYFTDKATDVEWDQQEGKIKRGVKNVGGGK